MSPSAAEFTDLVDHPLGAPSLAEAQGKVLGTSPRPRQRRESAVSLLVFLRHPQEAPPRSQPLLERGILPIPEAPGCVI